jgi:hypothetical protein
MMLSVLVLAGATAPAVHIDPAQAERPPNGTMRIGTSPEIHRTYPWSIQARCTADPAYCPRVQVTHRLRIR